MSRPVPLTAGERGAFLLQVAAFYRAVAEEHKAARRLAQRLATLVYEHRTLSAEPGEIPSKLHGLWAGSLAELKMRLEAAERYVAWLAQFRRFLDMAENLGAEEHERLLEEERGGSPASAAKEPAAQASA